MRVYHTFALPSVLRIKDLDPLAAFVLGRLIWFSIKTRGDCFYQLSRCCEHLQIGINRARRIFRQLEKENLITANHGIKKITYRVNWKHPAIMADLKAPDCDVDDFDPPTDPNRIPDGSKSDPSDVQGSKTDGSKSDPLTDPNRIPDGSKSDPLRDPNRIPLHTYRHTQVHTHITDTERRKNPAHENAKKTITYPQSIDEVKSLMTEWVTKHVQESSGAWAAFLDLPLEAEGFFSYWAVEHGWKRKGKAVKSVQGSIATWLGRRKTECERAALYANSKKSNGGSNGGWARNSTEYKQQIAKMFLNEKGKDQSLLENGSI